MYRLTLGDARFCVSTRLDISKLTLLELALDYSSIKGISKGLSLNNNSAN